MSAVVPPNVSLHLRLIGLISAIFVVYIHATTLKYGADISWLSPIGRIQGLLSHNMLHVAIPIFFLNASFFLFAGLQGVSPLYERMRRRIYSLLVPYLAWSAFWLILVLGLNHLAGFQLVEFDGPVLRHLFVDPLPGQLWFLRDLLMLVVFSPLVLVMPFRLLVVLTISVLCWWLFEQTPSVLSMRQEWYEVISNEAIAWFFIGAAAARKPVLTSSLLERGAPITILILLAAIWLVGPYLTLPSQLAHGISIVAGTLFLLFAINPLAPVARHPIVNFLSGYGFLFYLGHHPALGMLESVIIALAPGSVVLHALVYVFMPLFVIAMIVLVFGSLYRLANPIVFILNGGRSLQPIGK